MRNSRLLICLLLAFVLMIALVCVGCKPTEEEPDHSAPPTTTILPDSDYESELIVPDKSDVISVTTTTTTLGYTTGTGSDASTAHVTVTTDNGEAVTTDGGEPVTSFVSTTTTTTTTTTTEATTTTTTEVKLPFVPF